ncbi:hypothetical protein [Massilia glaciei]|nr:hypothetical protein [Massilia glaciei]
MTIPTLPRGDRRVAAILLSTLLVFLLPGAAFSEEIHLAPSPALVCLTRVAGSPDKPAFPDDLVEAQAEGKVSVELEFHAPDAKPTVKIRKNNVDVGPGAFSEIVNDYVRAYRVPCMKAGEGKVTLLQDYVFIPYGDRRIYESKARDPADDERAEIVKCLVHQQPGSKPAYPLEAMRKEHTGKLVARLTFTAPDKAPGVEWVAAVPHKSLRDGVAKFVQGYRLPCMKSSPVTTRVSYQFSLGETTKTYMRDLSLVELLGNAKDLDLPAVFDFGTMACPFDVRVTYYRPFEQNSVEEFDLSNPARAPLLKWLEGLTFNQKEAKQLEMWGMKVIVRIPCGALNL